MSYYSDQAAQFQQMAQAIQDRLTNANPSPDNDTYNTLCQQRDGLLNQATAMITADIQGTLNQLKLDQGSLTQCTTDLKHALAVSTTWTQIINIAGAGLSLVTACASGNPGAALTALVAAEKAVVAVLPKKPAAAAALKAVPAKSAAVPGLIPAMAAQATPPKPKN